MQLQGSFEDRHRQVCGAAGVHGPHHGATPNGAARQTGARAGISTLRGAFHPDAGIAEEVASKIKRELEIHGMLGEPLGVDVIELPILAALQDAGIQVVDGQQVFLEARRIKTRDEIGLSRKRPRWSTPRTRTSTTSCVPG